MGNIHKRLIALAALSSLANAQSSSNYRVVTTSGDYKFPTYGNTPGPAEKRAKLSSKGQSSYGPTKGRLKG